MDFCYFEAPAMINTSFTVPLDLKLKLEDIAPEILRHLAQDALSAYEKKLAAQAASPVGLIEDARDLSLPVPVSHFVDEISEEVQLLEENPQLDPSHELCPSVTAVIVTPVLEDATPSAVNAFVNESDSESVNKYSSAVDMTYDECIQKNAIQPLPQRSVDVVFVENSFHEFHAACELVSNKSETFLPQMTQAPSDSTQFTATDVKRPWVSSDDEDEVLTILRTKCLLFVPLATPDFPQLAPAMFTFEVAAEVANTKNIIWDEFMDIIRTSGCHIASSFIHQCILTQFPFGHGAN